MILISSVVLRWGTRGRDVVVDLIIRLLFH